jgi:hypothetical protein
MTETDTLPDRGHNQPPEGLLPILPLSPDAEAAAKAFADFVAERDKPMPEDLPYDAEIWFGLNKRVSDFCDAAGAWADLKQINSAAQSERLTDFVTGFRGLAKIVGDTRVVEKKPHADQAATVDLVYNKMLDKLDRISKSMKLMQGDWLVREKVRLDAEKVVAAAAAAEKLAAAQKAAVEAAARNDISGAVEAEALEKEAAKEVKAAARTTTAKSGSATGAGKAMSMRDVVEVSVSSIGKAIMHYREHPELRAVIETLAAREARAKGFDPKINTIPGIDITIRQVAV